VIRHVKILVVCVIVRWKVDKVGKWIKLESWKVDGGMCY